VYNKPLEVAMKEWFLSYAIKNPTGTKFDNTVPIRNIK
jgi:hypothetical protein